MKRVIAICHNFARGHRGSEGVNFVTTPLLFFKQRINPHRELPLF